MRKLIVLLLLVIILLIIILFNKKDKVIIIDGNTTEVSETTQETTNNSKNIILPGFDYLDIHNPGMLLINYNEDYYLKFSIYLQENDELIYSSDLVAYNNYISEIVLNRDLEEGIYYAYLLIEPFDKSGYACNRGRLYIKIQIWRSLLLSYY